MILDAGGLPRALAHGGRPGQLAAGSLSPRAVWSAFHRDIYRLFTNQRLTDGHLGSRYRYAR